MKLTNGTDLSGGKYKIISKISQGNFGITYLAEQTNLERKVCIKEFFFRGSCERSGNGQVTVTNSGKEVAHSFLRKFMREAKRLSKFDHPNIVKVIDVFEENGTAYMVMDYVDGETLQQLVDRKGKLSESEALGYILPLCDALEVVHEKELLHLDIKPSNILIKNYTNTPVLIDFGISKFTESSGEDHATTTPVALTKGYAPLEQYGQDLTKLTALTDVYSVAATLYKLVTGLTPPEAAIIVQDGLKPPKEINPTISGQLNSIILQSLSVKPSNRALSINKLKADLMGIGKREVVPEADRGTEVLYSKGEDEKKKQAVAQKTEVATEVIANTKKQAPKNPYQAPLKPIIKTKKEEFFVGWRVILVVIVVITIFIYILPSNDGNQADITKVQSAPIISKVDENNNYSTITDIDGNVYKTVKIGNQEWIAENLKVTRYRNGDAIPNITDGATWQLLATGALCNYDNNSTKGDEYGKLYNWYAVSDSRIISPKGWHIPSDDEWTTLTNYLGGENIAGGRMKVICTTCFSWSAGGCRNNFDTYFNIGASGSWWSSTKRNMYAAWARDLQNNSSSIFRYNTNTTFGLSVRCIKD